MRQTVVTGTAGALSLALMSSVAFAETVATVKTSTLVPATCIAALDAVNVATSAALDVRTTKEKAALQTKTTALKAAVLLTDVSAQNKAVVAGEKAYMTSMHDAMKVYSESIKTSMQNLKTACPGLGGRKMNHGMLMRKNEREMKSRGKASGFMGKMMKGLRGGPNESTETDDE